MPDYIKLFTVFLGLVSVVVTYFGVNVLKAILTKVPKVVIPFVAIAVAAAVQYIAALATGAGVNPYLALLYGFLASRLHDIWQAATGK